MELLSRLKEGYKHKSKKWDGKWRLIIWDIPEGSRKQRDNLRNLVRYLGFLKLQNSVFVTPWDIPDEAVQYLKESGLSKFVNFLRADKIDNEDFLKDYFDL